MPWGYVAVAYVTGTMASEASEKAGAKADVRAEQAAESSAEVLALEKERMAAWGEMYGDIEQNLADFYENLTPEFLTTAGLQEEAKSFATAQTKIKTSLAQRGLGGGGLEADILAEQEIKSAEERAKVRRDAPLQVAEAQQKFLEPKLARKASLEAGITSALVGGAAVQSQLATEEAQRAEAESSALWSSTGDILGAGLKQYATQPDATNVVKSVGTTLPVEK